MLFPIVLLAFFDIQKVHSSEWYTAYNQQLEWDYWNPLNRYYWSDVEFVSSNQKTIFKPHCIKEGIHIVVILENEHDGSVVAINQADDSVIAKELPTPPGGKYTNLQQVKTDHPEILFYKLGNRFFYFKSYLKDKQRILGFDANGNALNSTQIQSDQRECLFHGRTPKGFTDSTFFQGEWHKCTQLFGHYMQVEGGGVSTNAISSDQETFFNIHFILDDDSRKVVILENKHDGSVVAINRIDDSVIAKAPPIPPSYFTNLEQVKKAHPEILFYQEYREPGSDYFYLKSYLKDKQRILGFDANGIALNPAKVQSTQKECLFRMIYNDF